MWLSYLAQTDFIHQKYFYFRCILLLLMIDHNYIELEKCIKLLYSLISSLVNKLYWESSSQRIVPLERTLYLEIHLL